MPAILNSSTAGKQKVITGLSRTFRIICLRLITIIVRAHERQKHGQIYISGKVFSAIKMSFT